MSLEKLSKQAKEGGKDILGKIERGRDVSEMFARAFVKHDLQQAIENQGSYIIRDNLGRPILVNPRGGISQMGGMPGGDVNQLQGLSNSPMSIAKSAPVTRDFRSIGASDAPVEDEESKQAAFAKFVDSLNDLEIENLKSLSKDRILVNKKVIEKMHSQKKEVGVERLIENGLVKWEELRGEGLIEFRITALGRRVTQSL